MGYFERSNENKLSTTHGKIGMVCPICGVHFMTYACWAKRVNTCYCGRGCAAEGKKVRIITHCVSCGKDMEQTPSDAARVVTCSKECSTLRRRLGSLTPARENGTVIYKDAAKRIAESNICVKCGITHGPWCVVGLKYDWSNVAPKLISDGELWCQHCHLLNASNLGIQAKREIAKGEME